MFRRGEASNVWTCCFKIAFQIQGNVSQRRLIMDSEPGPGDVSRHVPGLCCLLTLGRLMKREGGGGRRPLRVCGASRPTAVARGSDHLSSALSRMYLDSSGGWRWGRWEGFAAIYFQINTQLRRGRFTPLPIFKMKLWAGAITLSQGKASSINSWWCPTPARRFIRLSSLSLSLFGF